MNVYRVKFEKVTDNDRESAEGDSKTVAAKDAESAIAKVKKVVLAERWNWEDDDGKERTSRYTSVSVDAVEFVAHLDG